MAAKHLVRKMCPPRTSESSTLALVAFPLNALFALQRLEELAEQAYKSVRHRDEATLPALKVEIDEQVARLHTWRSAARGRWRSRIRALKEVHRESA